MRQCYLAALCVVLLVAVSASWGQYPRSKIKANQKAWEQATSSYGSDQVMQLVTEMYAALTEERWKDFAGCFCRDATISTVQTDTLGAPEQVQIMDVYQYIELAKPHIEGKRVLHREILNSEVRTYESMAQVWVQFEAEFGPRHRRETHGGIDAITLHYINNRWKIIAIAYTSPDRW